MRPLYLILFLGTLTLQYCKTKRSNCKILEKDLSPSLSEKTILTEDDTTREFRDIGEDTITGGYYTFKNGFLKSYYFLTKYETGYTPKSGDELLEEDRGLNKTSFCSYAELYNDEGQLTKTVDVPLVYRYVNHIRADSICVNAKFFALNKTYGDIHVATNSGYRSTIKLTNDTLFSNMKQACFQFYFGRKEDVRIYITGSFVQTCSRETTKFADTILLSYKNGKLKSGG
jgi:hypothetical protein